MCGRAAGSAGRTLGSKTSTCSTVSRTALVFQLLSNLRNISIRSATPPKPLAPASLYRNVSRFRFLYLSKNRIDYEGDTFEIEMLESLNQNVTVRTIQDLSEVAAERQSVRLKSISHNFRNENLLVHLNEKKNLAKSSILRESPPDLRTFSRPSKVLSADAARSRLSRAYVCT
jgi:hypothetical protein